MVAVRVTITRWVCDDYPGCVEAQLVDAHGRAWSFIDKEPVLSADSLDATSPYPLPGVIACEVIEGVRDAAGRDLVQIDTERPCGVESVEGETRFEVPAEALVEA
jgi:hypothetical protein